MNWDEKYIFEEVVLCSFLLFFMFYVEETLLFSRWNGGSLHFILLERKNKVPGRINLDVILDIRNFVLKIFEILLKWSTAEAHTLWFWAFLGSGLFRCHNFEGNPKTSGYEFYLYVSAVHKKLMIYARQYKESDHFNEYIFWGTLCYTTPAWLLKTVLKREIYSDLKRLKHCTVGKVNQSVFQFT